jgi:hypothetical protein
VHQKKGDIITPEVKVIPSASEPFIVEEV